MNRTARLIALFIVMLLVGLGLGRAWKLAHQQSPNTPALPASSFVSRTQEIMATPITVEARADQIDQAAAIVFGVFAEVDARMSEWKDTSPLSAVNHNAGVQPVPVPDDLRALLHRSVQIAELTDGAFDPTWAALWGLWDFKAEQPAPPEEAAIRARTALVDYRLLQIDDDAGTAYLPKQGMLVGLGGIAKGYALDRANTALHEAGISDFLISGGGQILACGAHADRPWRVGIRDPRGPGDDFFARLTLQDESVSTSGDYERFFVYQGVRYHHVLDPRTGQPARGVRSATVISADATLADALSTALMIVGVERGMAIVESLPGVEAVMVDDAGGVTLSSGARTRVELMHKPAP